MFGNKRKRRQRPQQQRRPQQQNRKPKSRKSGGGSQQARMAAKDMQGFAEMLLENDKMKGSDVEEEFDAWFSRDAALTFLSEEEKNNLLRGFDDVTLANLMTKFPHEFSGEDEVKLSKGRAAARIRLNRAVGRGQMNERTMLSTQIQQNKHDDMRSSPSGGVMAKAKRMAGLGGGQR